MNEPAPEARGNSRAAHERFVQMAKHTPDLFSALRSILAPDCRVHVQNGDTVTPAASEPHAMFASRAFPDMAVTLGDVSFPGDRMVLQFDMDGRVGPGVPFLTPGEHFVGHGCSVGRVGASGFIDELWMYLNPGLAFIFPPTGAQVAAPPADDAGQEQATALYGEWLRRAEADGDLVRAIASTMAPEGVVHLGNGDVGGAHVLHDLFARILDGIPDLTISIEDVLLDDSRVLAQFSMSGTHLGAVGPWPATGRTLPSLGALIARADRNAQAAELWLYVAPAYSLVLPPQSS
ncbi:MAG: nuclear transport factor 2 family protein [Dehalococcoidia bacterium]